MLCCLQLLPGLHVCGEVLDVFGRIGGFNFLWAWVTGVSGMLLVSRVSLGWWLGQWGELLHVFGRIGGLDFCARWSPG